MMLKDGYTLMHEHMKIDLSSVKQDEDCRLDCFEETVKELNELYRYGVRNIVEVSNIGMGRDIAYIKKIELATGIHMFASTGWYKEPFIPEPYIHMSSEELANIMICEIEQGIEDSGIKATMIGEIGTSKQEWKESERKLFDAAILAHKATNTPIYTHTTLATLAYEQARYLIDGGVNPKKIIIGHMDLSTQLEDIVNVLEQGVFVGFDTIGKHAYLPDEQRIAYLLSLEKKGYASQLVLSQDLTRKSHLKYKGGIGYTYMFETFLPMARKEGISEAFINQMLCENPKMIMEK